MQYFPDLQLHLDTIHASASINCMKWFLSIFVGIFPTEVCHFRSHVLFVCVCVCVCVYF